MGILKEKMIASLKIRGYSERTQKIYIEQMIRFVRYFNISPDKLTKEHIFEYQRFLIDSDVSWTIFNQSVCSIRFFYNKVIGNYWIIQHIPFKKKDTNFLMS